MSHAEQLERETEQTRAAIADTLDELRACMTPGHVLNQLADRMSDGSTAAFARNLRDQSVNNPLPVALIGTGLAWLMLGRRATRSGDALGAATDRAAEVGQRTARDTIGEFSETADTARELAGDAADTMRDRAASAADTVRDQMASTADAVRDQAASAADSVQRTAATGYQTFTNAARRTAASVTDSTKAASQRTLQSGSALVDFCREQPLVLAGLGIALGAIMGALVPATEAESRLMGETSDEVKERAQDFASRQYEDAKQAVEKVGEQAADALQGRAGTPADQQDPKLGETGTADEPTLAPSGPDEWQGRPWPKKDEPL